MPAAVVKSVATLHPYLPSDIGPLVAKDFALESRLLSLRTKCEIALSAASGFLVTGMILNPASLTSPSLTGFLMSNGVAAATGVGMWLMRREFGQSHARAAKVLGKRNFERNPEYYSATDALGAAETSPQGSLQQMIALRHALTHVPLQYGEESTRLAAKILAKAEVAFPGSLMHMDATLALIHATHPSMDRSSLALLSRNLLEFAQRRNDIFERTENRYFRKDEADRLAVLHSASSAFAISLFRMKFEDPRAKCDSLNLVRNLLDKAVDPSRKDSVLNLLRENCIEAYLGYISDIPSPADKLLYLKEAAAIPGLEKDQKKVISALVESIRDAKQFTAAESIEAQDLLGALVFEDRGQKAPAKELRKAA
jgi:hypothetical protein